MGARSSSHSVPAAVVALLVTLAAGAARADDLGAIGMGGAVLLVLAGIVVLAITCIVLAVALGRWIRKPARTSGFVMAGTGLLFAAAWFVVFAVLAADLLDDPGESLGIVLAWVVIGGGVLSIAPVIVAIRSVKLIRLLLKREHPV